MSFREAEVSAEALYSVPRVQWVLTHKAEKGTFLIIELAFPRKVGRCHLEGVAKESSAGLGVKVVPFSVPAYLWLCFLLSGGGS